ncbi:MAG: DUF3343 domain-containing protein [Oscillospiraceae bacterium]|nr:DUF3343 domain-containing protein [Oscillospiraceae bacterium]
MQECYITFRSVTDAQRGEMVLNRIGIAAVLVRTPKMISNRGCGYSLRLPGGICATALRELQRTGVPMSRVFQRLGNNFREAMP